MKCKKGLSPISGGIVPENLLSHKLRSLSLRFAMPLEIVPVSSLSSRLSSRNLFHRSILVGIVSSRAFDSSRKVSDVFGIQNKSTHELSNNTE